MRIRNLKIRHKLIFSFSLVIFFLLFLAAVSYLRVSSLSQQIHTLNNERYPIVESIHAIKDELNNSGLKMYNLLVISDADDLKKELTAVDTSLKNIDQSIAHLNGLPLASESKQLAPLTEAQQKISKYQKEFMGLAKQGRMEEAKTTLQFVLHPAHVAYIDLLDSLLKEQSGLMASAAATSDQQASSTKLITIVVALLASGLSALLAYLTIASITKPLLAAVQVAKKVADADLRNLIETEGEDETAEMLTALKGMNDHLTDIVVKIRAASETMSSATQEIAQGNLDLSARTEHQAGSLEETASTMEQLTAAVRHNAENAGQASQLAQDASHAAQDGGQIVGRVVGMMGEINQSSSKIVDIISVIDGIAFQTNILALNAAVEAARAGEQGRGFAVVASEVRNLAQRSASAAKEIKVLISDSVDKIAQGSKMADHAGHTMLEIVKRIEHVNTIVKDISAATRDQTSGIEQVNQAITNMDEVTQQNAALVEQAAAAANAVQEQAEDLADLVHIFQLPEGAGQAAAMHSYQAATSRSEDVSALPRNQPALLAE